ncbi:MAG TPA: di-trans,poly-cis-decaprenylcistransferase, partial [Hellea balneolensis]|nr:di-trans,poly-cis-decaprenylcistransferase [Hellea balneolensis]
TLHKRGVRIRILGTRRNLSEDMLTLLQHVETTTKDNTKFSLNIAFNYGGRDEIVRAARRIAQDLKDGNIGYEKFTEAGFAQYLDTDGLPDPDLVIRTSGETRISNFLLWQAAYAEFVFSDVLWPDFSQNDLLEAIKIFQNRERRFGNLKSIGVA